MNKEYELTVEDEKGRLDKFISSKIDTLSRTQVQDLIAKKHVLVNNKEVKGSYKVTLGDRILITVPPKEPLSLEPEDLNLEIVYEDQDVIVVNKPQGMVVHPAAGHPDHTLVNGLLYHTKKLAQSPEGFRPGIVHRIDKDTSGLLMVAKNDQARLSLEQQLASKTNKREYLAIVHGNFDNTAGVIDAPIGRNPNNRKQMAVNPKGKPARTHFEVLEQFKGYSLVKCVLETGRTHQIRVHMKYIGHPLAGDPLYGPKKTLKGKGQFLHAATLGFEQPTSHQWLEFSAPIPLIFQQQLEKLRSLRR
ncbi:RluA family pseudouridine synthase [Lactobacillus sp. PV034]|uniref:RluA family pseudouridine synthase n=1 Tax=Lactobacillus sp. PV034 TaxID=2594495 RepID=UPI00223EEEB9|nr:RluA family pseudouridine synthase [Lactobacillus sp. PV034]QNQ80421.1 RluA family pseudouridine synthase [Lactobacillus sp. PV034]